ncbi:TetR/AcrR family transcriptional regulator [uncultured Amnibacterium sp.]|uniref:TetR/AcrR family transcriptional regulator n=1 Tax=uncultured Amnibacterium sp. TaxID=1631851 RepID=UPI0035CB5137
MASTRDTAIDSALALLRTGGSVSLDSVANAVGLTKAGLMHHFPTKAALMLALVDRVVDRWEAELDARLPAEPGRATPRERVLTYLDWCLSPALDPADLVMVADPRLRVPLTERWCARFEPWFGVSPGLPADERGRIAAVRLLADGAWFATASGMMPPAEDERAVVRAAARGILER